MAFKKRYPDASLFAELPNDVYEFTGGIENDPVQLLALARIVGGEVYGTDHSYTTTTNRVIEIPVGTSWLSLTTIREDAFAATGKEFSRGEIKGAVKRAIRNGYIDDEATLFNGRYGKIYSVSDKVKRGYNLINPVEAYRYFYHADIKDFKRGEIVVGEVHNRGKYGNVHKWINHVARKGLNDSAFTTVGRWRYGEEGEHDKPVFVPYLVIDIDRELLTVAFDDAKEIVRQFYQEGLDLARTFVSYSGRRGFHIHISTDQFGSPIFSDAMAAKKLLQTFVSRVIDDVEVDPHTFSPLSLVRLTNSIHEKTGHRKVTFTADDFLNMTLQDTFVLETVREFPAHVEEVEDMLVQKWEEAIDGIEVKYSSDYGSRVGPKIGRILKGVAESEVWSEEDVGRNRAAYILSYWLLEDDYQREQVADLLGYSSVYKDTEAAWDLLEYWNRNLNTPPLRERELKRTFNSAYRKVNGISY